MVDSCKPNLSQLGGIPVYHEIFEYNKIIFGVGEEVLLNFMLIKNEL